MADVTPATPFLLGFFAVSTTGSSQTSRNSSTSTMRLLVLVLVPLLFRTALGFLPPRLAVPSALFSTDALKRTAQKAPNYRGHWTEIRAHKQNDAASLEKEEMSLVAQLRRAETEHEIAVTERHIEEARIYLEALSHMKKEANEQSWREEQDDVLQKLQAAEIDREILHAEHQLQEARIYLEALEHMKQEEPSENLDREIELMDRLHQAETERKILQAQHELEEARIYLEALMYMKEEETAMPEEVELRNGQNRIEAEHGFMDAEKPPLPANNIYSEELDILQRLAKAEIEYKILSTERELMEAESFMNVLVKLKIDAFREKEREEQILDLIYKLQTADTEYSLIDTERQLLEADNFAKILSEVRESEITSKEKLETQLDLVNKLNVSYTEKRILESERKIAEGSPVLEGLSYFKADAVRANEREQLQVELMSKLIKADIEKRLAATERKQKEAERYDAVFLSMAKDEMAKYKKMPSLPLNKDVAFPNLSVLEGPKNSKKSGPQPRITKEEMKRDSFQTLDPASPFYHYDNRKNVFL